LSAIIAAPTYENKQPVRVGICRLAKQAGVMLTERRHAGTASCRDEGSYPMKLIAYVLAIICLIAAVMYYTIQAGSLPTFMPGYTADSTHIHHLHAYAALVAAVVLFGVGWFSGRR
jgi:hypothetical protein